MEFILIYAALFCASAANVAVLWAVWKFERDTLKEIGKTASYWEHERAKLERYLQKQ